MKRKPTPEQQARAEERRQALKALWQRVSEMTEEQRAEFAEKIGTVVTCEGHPLTMNNAILLAYQADGVTVVGGYQQWQRAGRQVMKGQRSLGIWIPANKKDDPHKQPGEITDDKPSFFIFGSVFDISQTEPVQVKQ